MNVLFNICQLIQQQLSLIIVPPYYTCVPIATSRDFPVQLGKQFNQKDPKSLLCASGDVHVQCTFKTIFFHTRCCLARNYFQKRIIINSCLMAKVICMNENPQKERNALFIIIYNVRMYHQPFRFASIKDKKRF